MDLQVDKDRRGSPAVEPFPASEQEVQQHHLIKQMDHVPQMDLGLVLHKQAAVQLYMPLRRTNY